MYFPVLPIMCLRQFFFFTTILTEFFYKLSLGAQYAFLNVPFAIKIISNNDMLMHLYNTCLCWNIEASSEYFTLDHNYNDNIVLYLLAS